MLHLLVEEVLSFLDGGCTRIMIRMALVIGKDIVRSGIGRVLRRVGHPHHGGKQNQHKQKEPDDDALGVLPRMILPEKPAEVKEPQYRPHDEQDIGLRLHRVEGKKTGDQKQKQEDDHQRHADDAGDPLRPMTLVLRVTVDRVGNEPVDQRRAERGNIHDPADRRSSQEGNENGDHDDGQYSVFGNTAAVQLRERPRSLALTSGRVQNAAQGKHIPDQARQDDAEQREHQDGHARLPEIIICRIKRRNRLESFEIAHVPDIGQPAFVFRRIGGNGEHGDKQVERRGDQRGQDQDAARAFDREGVLLGEMRDILKADECPGRYDGDMDDLSERARPLRVQRGVAEAAVMPRYGDDGAYREADREDQRSGDHDIVGQAGASGAQNADEQHGADGQQRLAEPHLVTENMVMKTELEGFSQEKSGKKRNGGDICPQDSEIGQKHEPQCEETKVLPSNASLERVDTAGVR